MDLERYPEFCGVADCGHETDIALLVVFKDGKRLVSAASDFCEKNEHERVLKPPRLKPGVSFSSWITRCGTCYLREGDRNPYKPYTRQ